MTLGKINELIALCEKHFPDHCWLRNLKDDVQNGRYLQTVDDEVSIEMLYAPGTEICGVCGCGRSDDVQNLYRKALRAIKDRSDKIRSQTLEENLKDCHDDFINGMSHIIEGNVEDGINPTRLKFCDNPMLEEVVLHNLCNLGFTEHGSSIYGSWMTEKGEAALAALDWWFEDDDMRKSMEEK